jgi:hypothetical protein
MAKDSGRFVRMQAEGNDFGTRREIWVDSRTGVNYLWMSSGYAGGLTPLLDASGRPVVSAPPIRDE